MTFMQIQCIKLAKIEYGVFHIKYNTIINEMIAWIEILITLMYCTAFLLVVALNCVELMC